MRRLRQLLFLVLTLLLGPASPFLWAKAPPSSSRRASMVGSRRQQQLVGRASPHAAPAAAATAAHEVEEGEEERRLWQELSSLVAGPVEMAPLPAKPSSTSALDTLESAFPLRKLERLRDAGDPVALMAAVRSAAAGVWATMTNAGQQIEQRDGGGKVPSYFEAKGRGGQYRPRRRATKREAMMGMAVELFLSLLVDAGAEEGSSSGGNPLAPNSWCFTASVEALVRGARPNLALLLLEVAYLQTASPQGLTLVYKHTPPPGMESGLKMVLTSGIASLEEAGHEDLTDAVYLDAQRRHALDGYWSAVHPRVMDLHNHTISLSRAAVRHCYGEAFRSDVASASTPTPLLLQAAGADEEEAEAGMFEIIVGRGESLSPAVLRLLNEEFSPSQDARVRDDNPGRLQVPRQSIRAWMEARREGGLV